MRFLLSEVWRCAALAWPSSRCRVCEHRLSLLSAGRQALQPAPIDTYDVTIFASTARTRCSGRSLVDPGVRKVVVQGPPGGTRSFGDQREIALDVRPCTRYYLVAVQAEPAGLRFRHPRRLRGAGRRLHAPARS